MRDSDKPKNHLKVPPETAVQESGKVLRTKSRLLRNHQNLRHSFFLKKERDGVRSTLRCRYEKKRKRICKLIACIRNLNFPKFANIKVGLAQPKTLYIRYDNSIQNIIYTFKKLWKYSNVSANIKTFLRFQKMTSKLIKNHVF